MTANEKLKDIAVSVRRDIINETADAASGHPGGSLSAVEIMTLLYFEMMNIPSLSDAGRDRFVLSKGHCTPLYYGILAEYGAFPKDELHTFRRFHSRLQGHPDMNKLPGVDMTTGSLGLGICAAVGMALAAKTDGRDYNVYVLLGDGEMQEGSVWEALMAASHYKLDNLCVILDNNNLQIDGKVSEVMSIYPIEEKFRAFGFSTATAADGNDFDSLRAAFADAASASAGRPRAIIAKTVKGKGVSFMENDPAWHGTAPDAQQRDAALAELGGEV